MVKYRYKFYVNGVKCGTIQNSDNFEIERAIEKPQKVDKLRKNRFYIKHNV